MIALHLEDIKDFMNKLLCTELFDHFLMTEGSITTFVTHTIDGHLHPDFFDSQEVNDEKDDLFSIVPFSMIRPICFQLIKGKQTPLAFKFTFQLSSENQVKTLRQSGCNFQPEDVTGMYFHLNYQERQLVCTTGISYATFRPDKSLDQEWDRLIQVFLKHHHIPFEIL
jgi:hypothetical protein